MLYLKIVVSFLVEEMLEQINLHRKGCKLNQLEKHDALQRASDYQANVLCYQGKLSHQGMDQSHLNLDDRLRVYDFVGENIGENIAKQEDDNFLEVIRVWVKSDKHRKNIYGDYNFTGLSTCKDKKGNRYWVQVFGKGEKRNLNELQSFIQEIERLIKSNPNLEKENKLPIDSFKKYLKDSQEKEKNSNNSLPNNPSSLSNNNDNLNNNNPLPNSDNTNNNSDNNVNKNNNNSIKNDDGNNSSLKNNINSSKDSNDPSININNENILNDYPFSIEPRFNKENNGNSTKENEKMKEKNEKMKENENQNISDLPKNIKEKICNFILKTVQDYLNKNTGLKWKDDLPSQKIEKNKKIEIGEPVSLGSQFKNN